MKYSKKQLEEMSVKELKALLDQKVKKVKSFPKSIYFQ